MINRGTGEEVLARRKGGVHWRTSGELLTVCGQPVLGASNGYDGLRCPECFPTTETAGPDADAMRRTVLEHLTTAQRRVDELRTRVGTHRTLSEALHKREALEALAKDLGLI